MTKSRYDKLLPLKEALAGAQARGYATTMSEWTLRKICRENNVNHERSGLGECARIKLSINSVIEIARTLIH